MLNLEGIQEAFLAGSKFIGEVTQKEEEVEEPIVDEIPVEDEKTTAIDKGLKVIKAKLKKADPNAALVSSSTSRLKLKPLEKRTPLASEYYKNWRHHRHQLKNSKIGKRRRIDYKSFNKEWLK